MKVSDVWTFLGALILLLALGIVARRPTIVTGTLQQVASIGRIASQ